MVGFQCHSTFLKVYIFGIVASQQISNKQNIFYFFFQEDQDWGIVAMVLDRLFLWMFAITAISGSLLILSESPYIYDTTSPIDVVFSKIAQQEARIFDEDKLLVWDLAQPRQVWTQDHFVGHPMRLCATQLGHSYYSAFLFLLGTPAPRDRLQKGTILGNKLQKMLKCSGFWGLMIRL